VFAHIHIPWRHSDCFSLANGLPLWEDSAGCFLFRSEPVTFGSLSYVALAPCFAFFFCLIFVRRFSGGSICFRFICLASSRILGRASCFIVIVIVKLFHLQGGYSGFCFCAVFGFCWKVFLQSSHISPSLSAFVSRPQISLPSMFEALFAPLVRFQLLG